MSRNEPYDRSHTIAAATGLLCVLTLSSAWSRPTLEVHYEHATFTIMASANRRGPTRETIDMHHRTHLETPTQRALTGTCVPGVRENHYTVCFEHNHMVISEVIAAAIGTFAHEHLYDTFTIAADEKATATHPRRLARIRAQAIQAALVRAGVPAQDVVTKTRGDMDCPVECLDRAVVHAAPSK